MNKNNIYLKYRKTGVKFIEFLYRFGVFLFISNMQKYFLIKDFLRVYVFVDKVTQVIFFLMYTLYI